MIDAIGELGLVLGAIDGRVCGGVDDDVRARVVECDGQRIGFARSIAQRDVRRHAIAGCRDDLADFGASARASSKPT